MEKGKLAVLISSCDAYEDIWDPFFLLMNTYWKDIPYRVYLNTETKSYNKVFPHFAVTTLNATKQNATWSQRMKSVLERIEEEYVLVLIEDFFLREDVQTSQIEDLLRMMNDDPLMCSIQLFGTRINCDKKRNNNTNSELKINRIVSGQAKVVFVPTIWRKETLVKWLRPHESIWAFESCASARAYRWHYKEHCYRVTEPAIFNYLWEDGCYCVVNGKWMMHPLLSELFEKNGIRVDYSVRGTITMEQWKSVTLASIIKRRGFFGTMKSIVKRILSFF